MKSSREIKSIKNEDGAALVLAMMVLLVLSVLGAMVGTLTVGSYRLADNNQEYNSAYYIAEAGANMAYEEIKEAVNLIYKDANSSTAFFQDVDKVSIIKNEKKYFKENEKYIFESQSNVHPSAMITVDSSKPLLGNGKEKQYVIKSIGEVAGKTRTVEKPVKITWKPKEPIVEIPDSPKDSNPAIIMVNPNSTLFMRNNSTVTGDIFHNLENVDYGPGKGKKDEILTGNEYDSESFNSEKIGSYMKYIFSNLNLLNSDENLVKEGNVTIAETIDKNLIVKGNLTLNKDAIIKGNVIAEGTITMNNHTKIYGSIISGGNVDLSNHAHIISDKLTFDRLPPGPNVEVEVSTNELIESQPAIESND